MAYTPKFEEGSLEKGLNDLEMIFTGNGKVAGLRKQCKTWKDRIIEGDKALSKLHAKILESPENFSRAREIISEVESLIENARRSAGKTNSLKIEFLDSKFRSIQENLNQNGFEEALISKDKFDPNERSYYDIMSSPKPYLIPNVDFGNRAEIVSRIQKEALEKKIDSFERRSVNAWNPRVDPSRRKARLERILSDAYEIGGDEMVKSVKDGIDVTRRLAERKAYFDITLDRIEKDSNSYKTSPLVKVEYEEVEENPLWEKSGPFGIRMVNDKADSGKWVSATGYNFRKWLRGGDIGAKGNKGILSRGLKYLKDRVYTPTVAMVSEGIEQTLDDVDGVAEGVIEGFKKAKAKIYDSNVALLKFGAQQTAVGLAEASVKTRNIVAAPFTNRYNGKRGYSPASEFIDDHQYDIGATLLIVGAIGFGIAKHEGILNDLLLNEDTRDKIVWQEDSGFEPNLFVRKNDRDRRELSIYDGDWATLEARKRINDNRKEIEEIRTKLDQMTNYDPGNRNNELLAQTFHTAIMGFPRDVLPESIYGDSIRGDLDRYVEDFREDGKVGRIRMSLLVKELSAKFDFPGPGDYRSGVILGDYLRERYPEEFKITQPVGYGSSSTDNDGLNKALEKLTLDRGYGGTRLFGGTEHLIKTFDWAYRISNNEEAEINLAASL